jgi:hypothetical protein
MTAISLSATGFTPFFTSAFEFCELPLPTLSEPHDNAAAVNKTSKRVLFIFVD